MMTTTMKKRLGCTYRRTVVGSYLRYRGLGLRKPLRTLFEYDLCDFVEGLVKSCSCIYPLVESGGNCTLVSLLTFAPLSLALTLSDIALTRLLVTFSTPFCSISIARHLSFDG